MNTSTYNLARMNMFLQGIALENQNLRNGDIPDADRPTGEETDFNTVLKFDVEKYLNVPRPYPITLGQKMYAHAMPRQYTMLKDAPYVIIPVFKCKELTGESVSKLNPFSTAWCVIENIFLAATAEGLACSMRIPLNEEHDKVKARLKVPATYMIPVFIGVGYADPEEKKLEQKYPELEKQIHYGRWK